MGELPLSELIEQTKDCIRPFEHSHSTVYQYEIAWKAIVDYFLENNQVEFSKQLAQKYLVELRTKYEAGTIQEWRYKLYRLTTRRLIEYSEQGCLTWNYQKRPPSTQLHQINFIVLQEKYLSDLKREGRSDRTIEMCEIISRRFLGFLEQKGIKHLSEVQNHDVSLFIPFISKQYQPTSMRTVLSALRSFLNFVESQELTEHCLSSAVPGSMGRKTAILPTITAEEERKLLMAVDRNSVLGKRNYAMLLLALRTGLRSIDIVNLKMTDIHWDRYTIEVIQEKTDIPLVLPLLTDVGNAIADYILNGRPDSGLPYLFLRTQAPFQNLSGRSSVYGISCKIMKEAGIRQGQADRKGFHCLRHSMAARLLAEETPLPVISSILGHRDKDSTRVYLSTDVEHLRSCALSLHGLEVYQEELR